MQYINKITKSSIIFCIMIMSIFFVSSCGKKEASVDVKQNRGEFVFKDGVETYIVDDQVVKNRLIQHDGKLYYVDDDGHKAVDTWAIVDNDGHYGYFGSLGDLVVGKIRTIGGKDYYFDENGVLYQDRTEQQVKKIEGIEYIANKNGELRLASAPKTETTEKKETETKKETVRQTTAAHSQQVMQQQTIAPAEGVVVGQAPTANATQQTNNQASQTNVPQTTSQNETKKVESTTEATTEPFANAINISKSKSEPDEFGGPGIGLDIKSPTTSSSKTSKTVKSTSETTAAQTSSEVKIIKTEKVTDSVEGDDYECEITLLKPIMNGQDAEETENINSCIEDLMDAFMDDVMGEVEEFDTFPKSVTFTSAKLGTVNSSRIVIEITGSIKPKSGSSKSIKYRMIYDRKEINMDIQKTN